MCEIYIVNSDASDPNSELTLIDGEFKQNLPRVYLASDGVLQPQIRGYGLNVKLVDLMTPLPKLYLEGAPTQQDIDLKTYIMVRHMKLL